MQRLNRGLSLHELCNAVAAFDGERRPDPVAVGLIERGLVDRPALRARLERFYKAHKKIAQVAR
jgi:hypothetical protein